MRVLMTTDTVGGVWTYALELADALAAHDTEVVLATIGPPPSPGQRAELARSAVVDVRSLDGLLEWMDDPWADLERSGEWLLELRDEVRPDLVHLNAYAHGTLPWGVPVVVVGHSCVLSWWRAVRRENAPAEWDAYREAVTAGLALADLVVAPTRTMLARTDRCHPERPQAACRAGAEGAARARRRSALGRGEERGRARPRGAPASVARRRGRRGAGAGERPRPRPPAP
jgi:glycogen(starch) synthase